MVHSVTHSFVSGKADGGDTTIVRPSNWNAAHTITIDLADNANLSNTLANAKLANSSLTIGSTSVALGATAATIAGLTLTTPSLGVATASSINKLLITAPATSATLTVADGASLITAGAFAVTLTATAATNVTLPTSGTLANQAYAQAMAIALG